MSLFSNRSYVAPRIRGFSGIPRDRDWPLATKLRVFVTNPRRLRTAQAYKKRNQIEGVDGLAFMCPLNDLARLITHAF